MSYGLTGEADPAVEVVDLVKTYRNGVEAVRGLSFSIERGRCFGLLGPNGAGKSTTVGVLTTRMAATSGFISVAGFNVRTEGSQVRAHVGLVDQVNAVDRGLNVIDNLVFHGLYFGMDRATAVYRSEEALDWAGLTGRRTEDVLALSGGMCRRLVIARATMHDPQIVFLDEPSAGLDPHSRLAVYAMIDELTTRGVTIVLTTHYLEEADRLCDQIAVIDKGRLVALDTPAGLRRLIGAGAEISVRVVGDVEHLAAELRTHLSGIVNEIRIDGTKLTALVPEREGAFSLVSAAAATCGVGILDFAVTEPGMESVFMSLTVADQEGSQ